MQGLEPHLGVFLFVGGSLLKDRGQLLIAFLLGYAGEEGVLVAGLALACKCFPQVFLGLGALEFHNPCSPLLLCVCVHLRLQPGRSF